MKMSVKRISNKGEIVIPKSIREEKGLKINSKVEVISTKNAIIIMPLKKKIRELAGLFGEKGIKNQKDLDAVTFDLLSGM